jgi:DNA repair protein RecO (recombination protein O)
VSCFAGAKLDVLFEPCKFSGKNFLQIVDFSYFCIIMMVKTRAIVLHSFQFGDTKMIIDLFTEQQGRVSFVTRRATSKKGSIKKQYFQPFMILDIEYDYRQRQQLQQLKVVRIAHPFVSIPFDPYKVSISLFLAELVYHATRDEQRNGLLFAFMQNSIVLLDESKEYFSNFHLVFMLKLLTFLGFQPNLDDYHVGDIFDLRAGEFISLTPIHSDFVGAVEANRIPTLARMDYSNMHLFKMSHIDRNALIKVLLKYYQLHVPNFPELKSLAVLQEMFY